MGERRRLLPRIVIVGFIMMVPSETIVELLNLQFLWLSFHSYSINARFTELVKIREISILNINFATEIRTQVATRTQQ
jgi:hypothetical protein